MLFVADLSMAMAMAKILVQNGTITESIFIVVKIDGLHRRITIAAE
jgi:hypothetical protein